MSIYVCVQCKGGIILNMAINNKMPCSCSDQNDAAASQGMAKIRGHNQNWDEAREDSAQSQRKHSSADTPIYTSRFQNYERINFCC